jgi:ATP-dependent helicase/nuclease subunit B
LIRLPSDLLQIVLAGGTVLVPSRQRAHAARLAFAASQLSNGVRVWATPDILPVDAWLIREIEKCASQSGAALPRVLSPAEDWLVWRQCTAEQTRDVDLLNPGSLAESMRRAGALAAEYGIDISKPPSFAGAEAELLHKTQRAVDDRYRALGAATVQALIEHIPRVASQREPRAGGQDPLRAGQGEPRAPSQGAVTCAGFLQPSPRLRALGGEFRSLERSLARPTVAMAADESDELEQIADWCKRQTAAQPDTRLLVILPGSAGARERLATLIRQAIDPEGWLSPDVQNAHAGNLVVIEGGAPLADLPVVAHALSALRWLGGSSGDFEEVSEWLRAPYWEAPGAGVRARIDLWLRESGHMSVSGREWSSILRTAPAPLAEGAQVLARQINAATNQLGAGVVSPREWSERFRAALEEVHWPGERVRDSSEQQTVVRFHELLDEFGQLASSARAMSRDEAIHWVSELSARTAFRPADDDSVVTISAALADPVVLYDGIWVGGLHADAFPQPVQPDPFLPLPAQISAGIPAATAAGRLAEARALLTAWRAATGELVLSAPSRAEDLELLPSPLLAEWLDSSDATRAAPEAASMLPGGAFWLPQRMHRANMLEYFEDSVGLPWPLEQTLPAGTRSLELQNSCAFRAYSELRLGSSELGVPEPGVAPDVRGQLLHAALQVLWRELRDSATLVGLAEPALDALIERSVSEAADLILGRATDGDRAPPFVRECRRTIRLIKTLCLLERTRDPFRVEDTEFEKTLAVSGAQLKVRIDRLDELAGGGRAILDYKSGRRTTADWYGERPSHPQLLAYLAAIGRDVVAMATVNVTAREVRFDGIASSSQLLPKVKGVESPVGAESGDAWKLRTREWLECVERLASAFLAGRAVVDPKPGACDFCHAVSVCRVSDRGIDVTAELMPIEFESGNE